MPVAAPQYAPRETARPRGAFYASTARGRSSARHASLSCLARESLQEVMLARSHAMESADHQILSWHALRPCDVWPRLLAAAWLDKDQRPRTYYDASCRYWRGRTGGNPRKAQSRAPHFPAAAASLHMRIGCLQIARPKVRDRSPACCRVHLMQLRLTFKNRASLESRLALESNTMP